MRWLRISRGLTRDRKYGRAEVEGREFICIDTGGIDGTEEGVETRMAEQSLLAIEEADVVLFYGRCARGPDAGGHRDR